MYALGILAILFAGQFSLASTPITFSYQGRFTDANGSNLSATVDMKLQIYDISATCLLYEEVQENLAITDGLFNVSVGSGVADSKRGTQDPGFTMEKVFQNSGTIAISSNCLSGYTPGANDHRRMKVTVTNLSTNTSTVLTPLQVINVNPYSLLAAKSATSVSAEKLNNKADTDFVQVSSATTQTKADQLFNDTYFNKLIGLTSTYQGSGRLSVQDSPTAGSDAVNKNYSDANIGGKTAPSFAGQSGKYLKYNGSSWVFDVPAGTGAISSSDVTTALGYTPQAQSSEITALSGISSTGLISRGGANSYTTLGIAAPLVEFGGAIGLSFASTGGLKLESGSLAVNLGSGFSVNGSNQIVPYFGNTAGSIAQGNDSRLPSSVCSAGSFNRWDGSAWVCSSDSTGATIWNNNASDIYFNTGKVGIGTSSPAVALDVNGTIKGGLGNSSNAVIDFASGNMQYTSASCGALTLKNMKSGASYSLSIQGASGGVCSIANAYSDDGTTSLSVRLGPTDLSQTASKHLLISFMVMGSFVYVTAVDGY
jgi:hypothetical protein